MPTAAEAFHAADVSVATNGRTWLSATPRYLSRKPTLPVHRGEFCAARRIYGTGGRVGPDSERGQACESNKFARPETRSSAHRRRERDCKDDARGPVRQALFVRLNHFERLAVEHLRIEFCALFERDVGPTRLGEVTFREDRGLVEVFGERERNDSTSWSTTMGTLAPPASGSEGTLGLISQTNRLRASGISIGRDAVST